VGRLAGAARGHPHNADTVLPAPSLRLLAEPPSYTLSPNVFPYDEPANQRKGLILQTPLQGHLDPAHNLIPSTSDKDGLPLRTAGKLLNPPLHLLQWPCIAKLRNQLSDGLGVSSFDGPHDYLAPTLDRIRRPHSLPRSPNINIRLH